MPIVLVVVIRSFVSFFLLLLLVKLIGKQQVTQLTYFDYIVGITIGSIASTLSVQVNENSWSTMAGMIVWAALAVTLALIGLKSPCLRKIIEGVPEALIQNGKIRHDALRKNKLSMEELMSMLRTKDVFNIDDVEFAVFEPSGKLSVLLKSQKKPLTPQDMNISTQYNGMPTNIIVDGVLDIKALRSVNLTKAWLEFQLKKMNIQKTEDIFLAQLDTQGNLYIDMKDNKTTYIISTKT
ncbi:MAG: DUF421 domain-containing protein [Clostridiaceae bacterium]|jgi:uncharacterized membrane protein YcaP (DUF421 family)|nr:DUF421 domain-containing protein [Clostridiaceae bacterium]